MTDRINKKFQELQPAVFSLEKAIDTYMKVFSHGDFYSFSQGDEQKKRYNKAYSSLSLSFAKAVPEFMERAAPLSPLFFEADKSIDEENAIRLARFFAAYEDFEEAFDQFTETSERELSKSAPSPSALLDCARALARTISELKEANK